MNKKDYITILILICIAGAFFAVGRLAFSKGGREVYVTCNNVEIYSENLYENKIIEINEGICHELPDEAEFSGSGNLLIIEDGKAYITEADCRDKICVGMSPVSHVGESIVCMPHGIVISVR